MTVSASANCDLCSEPAQGLPTTHSESVFIGAEPSAVYSMASDITRTGEWSPISTACWWDEGVADTPGT